MKSMLTVDFINTLFDAELPEPSHWESLFPPRNLPDGAIVTRFAPSPTGFLHTGGVYVATLGKNLAHHSGGSYFIRIEDTDQAREVPGSREQFARAFKYFDIESDENDANSKWGTLRTIKARADISHLRARVAADRPCLSMFLHTRRVGPDDGRANCAKDPNWLLRHMGALSKSFGAEVSSRLHRETLNDSVSFPDNRLVP